MEAEERPAMLWTYSEPKRSCCSSLSAIISNHTISVKVGGDHIVQGQDIWELYLGCVKGFWGSILRRWAEWKTYGSQRSVKESGTYFQANSFYKHRQGYFSVFSFFFFSSWRKLNLDSYTFLLQILYLPIAYYLLS